MEGDKASFQSIYYDNRLKNEQQSFLSFLFTSFSSPPPRSNVHSFMWQCYKSRVCRFSIMIIDEREKERQSPFFSIHIMLFRVHIRSVGRKKNGGEIITSKISPQIVVSKHTKFYRSSYSKLSTVPTSLQKKETSFDPTGYCCLDISILIVIVVKKKEKSFWQFFVEANLFHEILLVDLTMEQEQQKKIN